MSVESVAKRLVELCNAGKAEEAAEELYSPNIVSIEAQGSPESARTEVPHHGTARALERRGAELAAGRRGDALEHAAHARQARVLAGQDCAEVLSRPLVRHGLHDTPADGVRRAREQSTED